MQLVLECKSRAQFPLNKKELSIPPVLLHYDPNKPIILASDASAFAVGGVISHEWSDGSSRPIAYALRTFFPAESRYSQIDKESLAIIFSFKQFHDYLYGRPFSILCDHKPLVNVFL